MINEYYMLAYTSLVERNAVPKQGAVQLIETLMRQKIPFLILTEQSVYTRRELCQRMFQMGFPQMSPDWIYTSTMAAIAWVAKEYPHKTKAAVFGGKGLRTQLREAGFEKDNTHPDWIFFGYQRSAGYEEYNDALNLLQGQAAPISTDGSRFYERQSGKVVGEGAVVRMLEYASGRKMLEFGRPSVITMASALKYFGCEADQVVFVGDDFEMDIIPALRCKMDTAYVTWGQSIYDTNISEKVHPKWIVEDLGGLTH